ncbi:MAG: hypothetical protein ABIR32_20905 [Ilumatobacteraceae bacterium]
MSTNTPFTKAGLRNQRRTLMVAFVVTIVATSCGSDAKSAQTVTSPPAVSAASSDGTDAQNPDTTLAGAVISQPAVQSKSAMRETVVAHVVGLAQDAGLVMDEACVAEIVAKLNDSDLAALAAFSSTANGAHPTLSAEGTALSDGLKSCVKNTDVLPTGPLGTEPATAEEDVCASVDVAALSHLHTGLGAGSRGRIIGLWGQGNTCRFDGDAGSRVTVTVTRDADVNGWSDEATDGDGINDGELRRGIGQLAVIGVGYAGAAVGDQTLIEVTAFPGFDLTADALAQALGDIVDGYPY